MRRTSIMLSCPECSSAFWVQPYRLVSGKPVCCSVECSRALRAVPLVERFLAKVYKTESCWIWEGARSRNRYGNFELSRGVRTSAHRAAWLLLRGPISAGLEVCHNCPGGDNPACVNPDHMVLGTRGWNARDASKKGQLAIGDRHWSRARPELKATGDNHWSRRHPEWIPRGERSGSRKHPERLARGEHHWAKKHPERVRRGEDHPMAFLTEEQVIEIRKRYAQGGISYKKLGAQFGVTSSSAFRIVKRKIWRDI